MEFLIDFTMNIREELLKEKTFTKKQCINIVNFALASPENLKKLIYIFLSDEYRLSQRAAWVTSFIAKLILH